MSALQSLFGHTLRSKQGELQTASVDADVVGIYFSAHWCPPCRMFTPQLASLYHRCKQKGKSFEVVFVSSDQNPAQFNEYFNFMPWLALPYEDRARHQMLSTQFGVRGIPCLVLIDAKSGRVITTEGRQAVASPDFEANLPDKCRLPLVDPAVANLSFEEGLEGTEAFDMEEKRTAFSTLITIVNNILGNPEDPKYRSLKKSNKAVQTKLGKAEYVKLLKLAGFVEDRAADAYTCPPKQDLNKLRHARELLFGLLQSMPPKEGEQKAE